jgi:putative transcriptional regulator
MKKAKMSQSVFAGFLNVTTSTVQKWESPASGKTPGGAAAKLLQIIEKKGVEALVI